MNKNSGLTLFSSLAWHLLYLGLDQGDVHVSTEALIFGIFATAFCCFLIERRTAWFFHLSGVLLLVFSAMILGAFKLVPTDSVVYETLQGPLVLFAIIFLTLSLSLKDLRQIDKKVLALFLMGSFASLLGGLCAGAVGYTQLGVDAFKIAAQLSASYIGGGENAVAMQHMYQTNRELFVSSFAVDNVLTCFWMVFCLWYAKRDAQEIAPIEGKDEDFSEPRVDIISATFSIATACFIIWASDLLAQTGLGIHKILWASLLSLGLGQIRVLKEYLRPAYLFGTILFTGFFFSIGAISDLRKFGELQWAVIAMPFIALLIHSAIIIVAARILNLGPLISMITSQALIGGPATAVALAQSSRSKGGVSVGIALGLLGYSIANFFGAFTYEALLTIFGI